MKITACKSADTYTTIAYLICCNSCHTKCLKQAVMLMIITKHFSSCKFKKICTVVIAIVSYRKHFD